MRSRGGRGEQSRQPKQLIRQQQQATSNKERQASRELLKRRGRQAVCSEKQIYKRAAVAKYRWHSVKALQS